jgi:manganese/zinc/iron transport system ATP- binding protein
MRGQIGYVPQRHSVDWDFPTTALDVVTMGLYRRLGWFRRPARRSAPAPWRRWPRWACRITPTARSASFRAASSSASSSPARWCRRRDPILDEPMAGVDATPPRRHHRLLKRLRDEGRTVIVVHHDLTTVQSYFDWLVMLNVRIVAQGRWPRSTRPRTCAPPMAGSWR